MQPSYKRKNLIPFIFVFFLANYSFSISAYAYTLPNESELRVSVEKDIELESDNIFYKSEYPKLKADGVRNPAREYNAKWERGEFRVYNVGLQRDGEHFIVAGIVHNDPSLIEKGIRIFDWAFAHQASDGSFPGSTSGLQPVSFFIQAVSHSTLLLKYSKFSNAELPNGTKVSDKVKEYERKTKLSAEWMIDDAVWQRGRDKNAPYVHRRYLGATALSLSALLTDDDTFLPYAYELIEDGLKLQRPDGANPESGGTDSGYHATGLLFAARWVNYFPDDAHTLGIERMIEKGTEWELSQIEPNGRIRPDDNTRTCDDTNREGEQKEPHYPTVVRFLSYWSSFTSDPNLLRIAQKVEEYRMSGGDRCTSSVSQIIENEVEQKSDSNGEITPPPIDAAGSSTQSVDDTSGFNHYIAIFRNAVFSLWTTFEKILALLDVKNE